MGSDRPDPDPDDTPGDRDFYARLADLDESLGSDPAAAVGPPGGDPARWRRAAEVVHLLRRVAPPRPPADGPDTPPTAHARTPAAADRPAAVERVGRFRVERVLGRGGAGVVYLAADPDLGRRVAVKVLRSDDPDLLARFRVEAAALATLQHPNVVQVFQPGADDGRPFLVMEYVPGTNLGRAAAGAPFPDREAARVVAAVARAVAAAHRVGVIHRDLKPANILLAPDGTPKVVDFGLARLVGADAALTEPGVALGTPGYMAPEMAAGDTAAAGPPVDVYGLGAVLYELLTGHPPFQGVLAFDLLRQIVHDAPQPVRWANPAAAPDLEAVCLKCLEKSPVGRYPTADALADDLDRFLAGRPTLARPPGLARRGWDWCRRHRVAVGLAVLAAAAVGAWSRPAPAPPPVQEPAAPEPADAVTEVGVIGREGGKPDRLAVSPAGTLLAASAAGRIRLWDLAARRPILTLPGSATRGGGLGWSGDGRRLVFARDATRVAVWDVSAGRVIDDRDLGDVVGCVALSPDGRRCAAGDRKARTHVWEVGAADGPRVLPLAPWQDPLAGVAFSADGQWVFEGRQGVGYVTARSVAGADFRITSTTGIVAPHHLFALPDGLRAVAVLPDRIAVLDLAAQTNVRLIPAELDPAALPRGGGVAPSGRWAAAAYRDRTVRVWDLATGRELCRAPCPPPWGFAVGPGGMVIVGDEDGNLREFRITGAD